MHGHGSLYHGLGFGWFGRERRRIVTNLNEVARSGRRFVDREVAIFRDSDGVVGRGALVDDGDDCVVGLGFSPDQVLATRLCAIVGEEELCLGRVRRTLVDSTIMTGSSVRTQSAPMPGECAPWSAMDSMRGQDARAEGGGEFTFSSLLFDCLVEVRSVGGRHRGVLVCRHRANLWV